jgi:hypothetical protein
MPCDAINMQHLLVQLVEQSQQYAYVPCWPYFVLLLLNAAHYSMLPITQCCQCLPGMPGIDIIPPAAAAAPIPGMGPIPGIPAGTTQHSTAQFSTRKHAQHTNVPALDSRPQRNPQS